MQHSLAFFACLAAAGLGILGASCSGGMAGCGDPEDSQTPPVTETAPVATTPTGTAPSADDDTESTPSQPAPYADVTAVTTTGKSGDYTFSVTIESADIDCTQYADWWEVIGLDATLLYRRILNHSHTDANGTGNPFTRDGGPVPITADEVVVVRAHMNNGGYQGKAMQGSVNSGFQEALGLPTDFAEELESLEPQPEACQF